MHAFATASGQPSIRASWAQVPEMTALYAQPAAWLDAAGTWHLPSRAASAANVGFRGHTPRRAEVPVTPGASQESPVGAPLSPPFCALALFGRWQTTHATTTARKASEIPAQEATLAAITMRRSALFHLNRRLFNRSVRCPGHLVAHRLRASGVHLEKRRGLKKHPYRSRSPNARVCGDQLG